jgi:hypothetical protein
MPAESSDRAHVFFLDGGAFLFMIRVVDEALKDRPGGPVWQVVGNRPEPLSRLVQAEQAGPPIWPSSFHISHRIGASLAAVRVYLAGGCRPLLLAGRCVGMNLGLKDA